MTTQVVLATDHAGFALKEHLKKFLESKKIEVIDVGTFSDESVDYPAIMRKGAAEVLKRNVPGFFFGGSGNGEAMAANKVPGIRAALGYSIESALLARSHNNANVLCMGGRLTKPDLAEKMAEVFLNTAFEGGRHERRINDLEYPTGA